VTPRAGSRRERTEAELRDFARLQVRAGLLTPEEQHAEVVEAVRAEMPDTDAEVLARAWLAAARQQLVRDQSDWPVQTDHDRLASAFAECAAHDVPVLQGVTDHWVAQRHLEASATRPRGVAWFTPSDVWHAIDEGMLEVNLWHGSSANVAPGDSLLDAVVGCLGRHGLRAHFDEGRIEVAACWQRRLA
jgi:hypothetical protein